VKNVEEAIKAFIWLGLIPKDIDDNVIEGDKYIESFCNFE
jgi:hypothetical protein